MKRAARTPAFLALVAVLAATGATACEPVFDRAPHLIDEPRVLATHADPPEVEPGQQTRITVLAAGPDGALADAVVRYALCLEARGLEENTTVAAACVDGPEAAVREVGQSEADQPLEIAIPDNACEIFGSTPPPPAPDAPPLRPQDPDATGGYYQPVRATLADPGATAFARVRIRCPLPAAPADVVRDYQRRYAANENPAGSSLRLSDGDGGDRRTLRLTVADDAREAYVRYDAARGELVEDAEVLTVFWFATAGQLSEDQSTIPPGGEVQIDWRPPDGGGRALLWAVLRDNRGGVSWLDIASSP